MPSLKKLSKDMEQAEAAIEKQLAQIRKEAEKVKGGEDRVDEIIAQKMRDLNLSESTGALKIPEHCVVNSRAHMRRCSCSRHPARRAEFDWLCPSPFVGRYAPRSAAEFDQSFFRNLPSPADFKKARCRFQRSPCWPLSHRRVPCRWTPCRLTIRGGCCSSLASRRTCHSSRP